MRNYWSIVVPCAIAAASLAGINSTMDASAQAPTTFDWEVRRYSGVPLDESRADQVIQTGLGILSASDGPDDVATDLDIKRTKTIGTFDSPGAVNSSDDIAALNQIPGRVHVVSEINFCGGTSGANIIGCSDVPGNSIAVVRMDDLEEEAILWMHEYGHNKGLGHRPEEDAVMNPIIGRNRRAVDADESKAYQAAEDNQTAAPKPSGNASGEITDFVRRTYVEGIDLAALKHKYTTADVTALMDMLQDPQEERYWSNVVVALGMSGGAGKTTAIDAIFSRLTGFVEQGTNTLTSSRYQAKKAALMSIGYLANRTDYSKAKDYVKAAAANEGAWKGLRWNNPGIRRGVQRNAQLAAVAKLTLGVINRADTDAFLKELDAKERAISPALVGINATEIKRQQAATRTGLKISSDIKAAGGLLPYLERGPQGRR